MSLKIAPTAQEYAHSVLVWALEKGMYLRAQAVEALSIAIAMPQSIF